MKRRVLTTTKILAVALTAAACGESKNPSPPPITREPAVRAAPETPEQGGVIPAAYRPPRDSEGYPLVGNTIRKAGADPELRDAGADAAADGGRR
jgi:hypothetical protein